jgi:catecholate siderophore receptor
VTKDAGWAPVRSLALEGGAFEHRRAALDVGQGMGARVAARLNGMLERSNSFRDAVDVRRYGLNPTLTLLTGARTALRLGYEYFDDARVVDRGIPSFEGRPSVTDVSTFFGDPSASHASARVQSAGATLEHETTRGLTIRNRTRFVHYDKFYQNVLPGAVNAAGTRVSLSAYNNGTRRANLFNQTDLTYSLDAGHTRHTLLAGMELGNQLTDNVRNTGYFAGSATSLSVPFDQPTVASGATFAPSATDANNHVRATVGALYAQDQVELSRHWQAIAGVRADRFEIAYQNNRDGQSLRRVDHLVSPRAGLVFKPVVPLSIYSAYSISYLPSAGDQFSSLTATSKTLEPERFTNQEIGAKWDVRPSLSLTGAFYRLDRTNTSAKDPNDVTRTVQTGRQRTTGFELGASGNVTRSWQLAGGFASQRAVITSATAAARAGATVPLVPRQTISLWNRYQPMRAAGVGLGLIHQGRSYAAIDNSVVLPEFTRVDGALFFELNAHVRAQANLENLLDARYYPMSQGNNNILPGAPRLLRVSLTTGF